MTDLRAVITGLGLVTPSGSGLDEFHANILAGKSAIRAIDRFDASSYPSRHAGLVDGFDAGKVFSRRLLKKLDHFTEMSLVATENAIRDGGLAIEDEDKERVGIILGNALGGWAFAETELRDLYVGGIRDVSPYQATAWFPAAPQGQISIQYGIKGFAKTIISDTASSHLAIGYAARAIRTGKADVVLAGGSEAPVSPYALLCCNTSGETSRTGAYRPFDKARDGYAIGEGAAVLVVEEMGRAVKRGARIYAEITGFGHTSDGVDPRMPDPDGRGMARAMRSALGSAGCSPNGIDYLMPAGLGGSVTDASESKAIRHVYGGALANGLSIGVPRTLFGNLLGASGAVDAVTACLALERGAAPTHTGCAVPDEGF